MNTISVFGSAVVKPDEPEYQDSYAVGRALGAAGYAVMTGGYNGVMEAASKGAAEAGAHVIGVTCTQIEQIRRSKPNRWVAEEIRYPGLQERLYHLVTAAAGYVVMPGGVGTFTELALAWELMRVNEIPYRPIICFGAFWAQNLTNFIASPYIPDEHKRLVHFVDQPDRIVRILQNGG